MATLLKIKPNMAAMTIPSHFLPLFLLLIILFLVSLISLLLNNDFFSILSIQTLSFFHQTNSNNNNAPYSSTITSRAISLNVTKCFPVDLPPHAITSNNCCPSLRFPTKLVDFKDFASPNTPLRVRKPAHLVDEEFIAKIEKGIALMKALPYDDPRNFYQQAKIHCAYCNGAYRHQIPFQNHKLDIHQCWFFFPFHRWYIYFFERILGNLIGDPNFALPFWNWDSEEGMHIPSYFANPNSSLFNNLRNRKHVPPHVVDLNYEHFDNPIPSNQQISFNLATMYKQMVLANTKELFMGSPLRVGDDPRPGIGSIEAAPHNTLHTWVGAIDTPNQEDMGTFYTAARDPVFYPHHSNLDRMWVLWKNLENGSRNDYNDPEYLNSEFFFYDENANLVRVKVGDCIDTKKLGYVYQDVDLPWLNHAPTTSPKIKLPIREGKSKGKFGNSKANIEFPMVLDSLVSTIVKRPKKLMRRKEDVEEVLVIEGIEFGSDKYVKFDIHVNDDEEDLSGPDRIEFVGSFVSVRHGHGGKVHTRFKVGISKVLENLDGEDEDYIRVTLVPKIGKGDVIIGSIKIELMPKN